MPFDGFISYSHAADGRLAPAVQRGLHRLAKPWHQRRALWIFRDQTGLAVTPKLWTSIQEALDGSKYFVLLASPEAALSPWVNREIEHWLATKSPDRILPVVTDGEWQWDPGTGDFTPGSTAVPAALRGVLAEEPLYLDLRWARDDLHLSLQHVRFRDAIAQLAAPMHGVSKDELEGEDVRQHRRTRRLSAVAGAALVMLTLVASLTSVVAVHNANRADDAAAEARDQQRVAAEQHTTAVLATEESLRQQENSRIQEGRARTAGTEARRQETIAGRQQELAESASAEAARQRALAEDAAAEVKRQRALAEEAAAEAEREQASAERFRAEAAREQAEAERQKANAERQQELAGVAAEEAARQKANAEQQAANARAQQELADQAAGRAKEQEQIAEHHRELARKADDERKRQEQLAQQAAEEAARQREAAALQQRIVINRRLMVRARSMIADDPRKALMLGVAAQNVHDDAETREQLSHLAMATAYAGSISGVLDVEALAGQAVATTGAGGTVSLWDTRDPAAPVRVAALPTDGTVDKTLAVSRDGRTLVVLDGRPEAARWDVTNPAAPVRMAPLTDPAGITAVNLSPDGRTVATSNQNGNTVLWDVTGATPVLLSTLTAAHPLKFSPDGRTGVTSGDELVVWDLSAPAAPVRVSTLVVGWGDKVVDADFEFNPSLPLVAIEGPSDYMYLFDVTDPAKPRMGDSQVGGPGDTNFSTMRFSRDGSMLAVGDTDGTTTVMSIEYTNGVPWMFTQIAALTARGGPVRAMSFGVDGQTLTTAGDRFTATMWNPKGRYARDPIATIPGPFPGDLVGLTFAPDGRSLLGAGRDGTAVRWDLTDPAHPVQGAPQPLRSGKLEGMMLSRDGRTMVVAGSDNVVTMLDMTGPAGPEILSTVPETGAAVWVANLSADGRTLAVGRSDGKMSLWDLTDRKKPTKLAGLPLRKLLVSIAFSPDGQIMAVGEGYNVSLWDMTDRSAPVRITSIPLSEYVGFSANVLEFSPDGRTLAGGTTDGGTTILWDVADPAQPRRVVTLPGRSSQVLWASFSPDGHVLATSGLNNSMVLWDISDPTTPLQIAMIKSPGLQSYHMSFSPDGSTLAAGGTFSAPTRNITLWEATAPKELAADPAGHACRISGRGLTADEWARYIPELPHQATC